MANSQWSACSPCQRLTLLTSLPNGPTPSFKDIMCNTGESKWQNYIADFTFRNQLVYNKYYYTCISWATHCHGSINSWWVGSIHSLTYSLTPCVVVVVIGLHGFIIVMSVIWNNCGAINVCITQLIPGWEIQKVSGRDPRGPSLGSYPREIQGGLGGSGRIGLE